MRRPNRALLFTAALAVLAGGSSATAGRSPAPPASPSGGTRLLVKFRAGTPATAAAALVRGVGATRRSGIPRLGVHVLSIRADASVRALARLNASPSVKFAERDGVVRPQELMPNDPFFPQTYALGGGAWGWYKTRTTQAWDITRGDPAVVVAVLDTGLKNVSDFAGQTVTGWNVMAGSTDTSSNAGNHGTYVAGVVGLASGNGRGNAGYCPGCRIMPVQVGTDSGAYTSDLASGIVWAADHGARVENLSWAGSSSSATLANAVSYARSKGVVVVAAAGNSNCDCPTYPAATPGVIGVAGTTNTDTKQGDSNYGSWVTLAAPEGNMTAWPSLNGAPGYAPVGGTSLAAPVVSAIAALVFSYDQSLTGTQVEQALETTASPVPFSVKYGRVDALAALHSRGATDPQPVSAPVNNSPPQVLLLSSTGGDTAPLSTSPQPGQMLTRGQGAWTGSAPLSLSAVQWQRCDAAGVTCATVGTSTKYPVQSADTGYALRVLVTVKNGIGSTIVASPLSAAVGGSTTASAPVSSSPPSITGTAQEGRSLSTSAGTWSGSPTSYAYQWLRCDSTGAACLPAPGATAATYALTSVDVGFTIRVSVTATNSTGSATATSAQTAVVASAAAPPPATQTLTFSGSLNTKNPARTYAVTVGSGVVDARLSFSRCSSLTLTQRAANNSVLASTTGASVLALAAVWPAGSYSFEVSGGRCSFTLTVTAPAP